MNSPRSASIGSRLKKAQALIARGQVQAAEQTLAELGRKHPGSVETWLLLASLFGPQGRYQAVADCCQRVLAIDPKQPVAYSLLGSACVYLDRREEAIEHLTRARKLAPGNPDILINLGNALYASGRFTDASGNFQAALQVRPGHPLAHFGLGNCCLAQGQWNNAVVNYRKAYHAMSGGYDINMSLGKAYINIGELDEAVECFRRAANLTDKPSVALCELATARQLQGHLDQALVDVEQSLRHQPDNSHASAERAGINYKLGNIDAAHRQIRELVEAGRVSPHIVAVWGQLCHHFDECSEVVSLGEALVGREGLDKANAVKLYYMLGKLYDRLGEYDLAFERYRQANSIMPEAFDRNNHSGMIGSLMSGYSHDLIRHLPRSGCEDERPVFIVGMPRSGTSLVEQVLASHSKVFGAGELDHIKGLAKEVFSGRGPDTVACLQAADQSKLDRLASRYLAVLSDAGEDVLRVTDKMPANFLWLGFIGQLFPRARVIHCRRDPRDTCLSIYFQQFNKGHSYATDLDDLAFYYRQYERLMAHWRQVLDIPLLEVSYAELVADLEGQARKMVDFLGLEWEDSCLDFHKSRRATATASWDQVRQPVHTRSVARWQHYRDHLGPLIAEFGDNDVPLPPGGSQD
jgi:tetratricopeptide (TPR) repeat protein